MNSFLRDTFANMAGSVAGGIILALVFFIASDFIFKPPDLSGRWLMAIHTEQTTYKPFEKLIVIYEIMLHESKDGISGTAEMLAQITPGEGYFEFENEKRILCDISGAVDHNYLSRDRVNIHWVQHGKIRDSSSFFRITRFDDSYMSGTFESTAANSSGISEWVRTPSQFTLVSTDIIAQMNQQGSGASE